VAGPIDIELPRFREASSAYLFRTATEWSVSFLASEAPVADPVPISGDALIQAGIDPAVDRLVAGYVETRLLAAGYGISPWEGKPTEVVEGWTLRS
jgi:hypothetical protein